MANNNSIIEPPTLTGEEAKRLQNAIYDMDVLFRALRALPPAGTMGTELGIDAVHEVVIRALCREGVELASEAGGILEPAGFFNREWQRGDSGHE